MDVVVSIGTETDPTVTVSISDDHGWSPDQLDDATRRAGTEALRIHRDPYTPQSTVPNAWQGSTRRERLPSNWPTIRARILDRDPICQCQGCRNCTPGGCPATSTDADHIIPIDDHTDTNLQGLCHRCHLTKTGRDNARYNQARADLRRRPPERHPGARGGG